MSFTKEQLIKLRGDIDAWFDEINMLIDEIKEITDELNQ